MQAQSVERDYHVPANAAHMLPQLICLVYLPSRRARKWRTACYMSPVGRDHMEANAREQARDENWHAWRVALLNVVADLPYTNR